MNEFQEMSDLTNRKMAVYAFSALIISSALSPAINMILGIGIPTSGDGSFTRATIYLVIFAASLKSTVQRFDSRTWWPMPPSMTLCIAWLSTSLLWAINPGVGFRRLALTLLIVWTTFALIRVLGIRLSFDLIRVVFGIILVLNYFTVFALPTVGLTDDTFAWLAGAWHGILAEKNHAGAVSAFTLLIFLFDARHIRASIRLVILAGTAYFLYKTNSKTSLGLCILASAAGYVILHYRPYYRLLTLAALLFCALLVIITLITFGESIMPFVNAYMDDPESLTGRVQIWPVLWEYFESNWLLGSGFGSFWNIGQDSPVFRVEGWVTEIASGHNGYLDLLVQIGLPGTAIVLLATLIVPVSKIVWLKQTDRQQSALVASILFLSLAHNLTESTLFDRDSIVFIFLLLSIGALCELSSHTLKPHAKEHYLFEKDRLIQL